MRVLPRTPRLAAVLGPRLERVHHLALAKRTLAATEVLARAYESIDQAPPAATVPEILEDARSMIAGAEQG